MIEYARRIVWIPVINMTAETIPGGALMEPYAISNPVDNGQDTDGNWTVRKPTVNSNPRVIVNGESPIPPGMIGQGHRDTMAVVLYDTTESKPLAGDTYGSKSGSWYAHKDYTGFIIDHAGNGRANAQRVLPQSSSSSSSNNVFVSQFTATATDGTYMFGPVVPNGKRIKGTATANLQFTSYTRSFDVLAGFMKCKNLGMTNNLPDSTMFPVEIWGTSSEMVSVGPIASSFFKYDTTSTLVFDYSNNTGSDVTMQFGPQNASSSGTVTFLYGLRAYYSLE